MHRVRVPGSFRIGSRRRTLELQLDPISRRQRRVRGIIDSIQQDLDSGGTARVRQILVGPRELYRLELELPDMAYQRTTILDRDTLTNLLETMPEHSLRDQFIFR